ncbi:MULTISPECIES: metallophosphoesterase [unclassified Bacillus (in: firmicutes)]|uniref:metallophosphoesterase n=1 Tax=unclassified Bacillus (in: firmicutes) TaxID=185979 RepID=UPI0008ECDB63|nr:MULTISPECIES: metallophosphoesterase [unclassified Bacillus (in: firmicutes)]SFA76796.1 hypothetical protein SAMN02799634_101620 [Bacillus sp. UNCCL13]SFQ66668.1 hypothetical protein SAMN04488577_0896 [Bacillus sp. cl95]
MPKKVARRTFLKRVASILLTAFGAGTGGYFYANKIEPSLLEITKHSFSHPQFPAGFDGLKVVQFSDTHLGFQYELSQLETLVKKINHFHPDIIFFTGDLMDEPNRYKSPSSIIPILTELKAKIGKFAIYGNHDHGGYGSDIYKELMEQSGFQLLLNQASRIDSPTGEHFYVAGVDDAMLGRPDLELTLRDVPHESFKILLCHEPDLADAASELNVHLQLSGHSHGGQIKIPFLGPLVKPPLAKIYNEGFYSIGNQNPLTLYVNRGLGTTRMPFRFLSKPELTVFTLKKDK